MPVFLYDHQKEAIDKMHNGCILLGGVGSGKSMTALGYYYTKILGGVIKENGHTVLPKKKTPLYIITTAMKRDRFDWDDELARWLLSRKKDESFLRIPVAVDSWNNISKYSDIKDAFFIFDEQRVVGSGAWVKNFLKIAKQNQWILLSATPGDTWTDYIPVFIANGLYKNRSQFLRRHAVFNHYTKYPKIDRFIETDYLDYIRNQILVPMPFLKKTTRIKKNMLSNYSQELYDRANRERWDVYKNQPISEIGGLCYVLRKIVNSDPSRLDILFKIVQKHKRLIVFYNGDYELEILRSFCESHDIPFSEWNGHKHEPIPKNDVWVYLVQYTAGSEGWNCIETNVVVFYSLNYSYKVMEQASGRIDRMNSPYENLYYYYIRSNSPIDKAIYQALEDKKIFNERAFENL